MAEPMIYKAISSVMSDIGVVGKDKINKQQGFKFRGIDDVMNALNPALVKNKVFVVPEIIEQSREERTTRQGGVLIYSICKVRYTFFTTDGSSVCAIVIGEGMDSGDKATNKAMSIAFKYACFQVFCIPTEELMEDPDAECPKPDLQNNVCKNDRMDKEPVSSSADKITEAMLNTIRSEQKRTGVTDQVILARKTVKAKKIEDMTVEEFKAVMEVFKKTPDLKKGENNEQCQSDRKIHP